MVPINATISSFFVTPDVYSDLMSDKKHTEPTPKIDEIRADLFGEPDFTHVCDMHPAQIHRYSSAFKSESKAYQLEMDFSDARPFSQIRPLMNILAVPVDGSSILSSIKDNITKIDKSLKQKPGTEKQKRPA